MRTPENSLTAELVEGRFLDGGINPIAENYIWRSRTPVLKSASLPLLVARCGDQATVVSHWGIN